jgi:hypothetical protein
MAAFSYLNCQRPKVVNFCWPSDSSPHKTELFPAEFPRNLRLGKLATKLVELLENAMEKVAVGQ